MYIISILFIIIIIVDNNNSGYKSLLYNNHNSLLVVVLCVVHTYIPRATLFADLSNCYSYVNEYEEATPMFFSQSTSVNLTNDLSHQPAIFRHHLSFYICFVS